MDSSFYPLYVGKRIRQARKNAGLTQQQLAAYVNIGQDTLSHYEQGHVLPTLIVLAQIASALAIDVHALIPNTYERCWETQHYALLFNLNKLSPLTLRYCHGLIHQLTEPCGESPSPEQHLNKLFDLYDLLEHDLRQHHMALDTLVTFTSMALMGMEMEQAMRSVRRQGKSR